MSYVDGFMIAVPTAKKEEYKEFAIKSAEIMKDYGALSITECWGDDVPDGEITSMPMAVKCEENETVVFSWATWESKAARDAGWEKVMKDERLNMPSPFDGKRIIYGGFEELISR